MERNTIPRCVMMIGPSQSGKSTWVAENKNKICRNPVIITDPALFAKEVHLQNDIIIDLPNLTHVKRMQFLAMLPPAFMEPHWETTAVVCAVEYDVLFERIRRNRSESTPSVRDIKRMISLYQEPLLDEFDKIIHVL